MLPFPNFEQITKYDFSTVFTLERINLFFSLLGNPHYSLKFVHVAGTKGKGSTVQMISKILANAGYKVGVYTSPHVLSINERIKIYEGTKEYSIKNDEIERIYNYIKPVTEKVKEKMKILTYFEVLTGIAIIYFYQKKVDIAVIETGLGGRLDATNIVSPYVSVITDIGYDHMDVLGNSLIKIAREKAGIIKQGTICISSNQNKNVSKVIKEKCKKMNSFLFELFKDFSYELKSIDSNKSIFTYNGLFNNYPYLTLSLIGEHQIRNASLAIATIEVLTTFGFNVKKEHIYSTLKNIKILGRVQKIMNNPTVIVDGAHNSSSAIALKNSLSLFNYNNLFLILGIALNKDALTFGKILCPLAKKVIFTKFFSPRAYDPIALSSLLKNFCTNIIAIDDPFSAFEISLSNAKKNDLICITGSFYLIGEILKKFFLRIDK
jgi:dihydrofolate synthase/folylpolyglutamate synthase